ncbi:membrane protein [Bordetella pertussis]|nr:membrane protein [Bordetella pertussis]CRE05887.1 membrane protein [Bordetella pertussis]
MRDYTLYGDQWQIDAKVVRWRLPALLAGVPPLYRLERLSGRYQDTARERSAPRSVHALDDWPAPDLAQVKRLVPNWLPFVDVQFGSAAYMPMFDGARYQVYLDPRGALFIRPADAVTAERLKQLGW